MPKARKHRRDFSFGSIIAESDPLLADAYYNNGDYDALVARDNPDRFVIGRTGSGKSAAFRRLEEEFPGKVIRIQPENLSLPYITNLDVIKQLLYLNVKLDPFLRALWKHVIIVEVLRKTRNINSATEKQGFLDTLKAKVRRDPAKVKAIEYVNDFGDRFWCEADERVKQIAETFENKVKASGGLDVVGTGLRADAEYEKSHTEEIQRELAAKYQRIVNDTQIARLNEMIAVLDEEILDEQHFTYLIIDDLDKEWDESPLGNLLIRCLFQAVVDMQRVRNLKILVALRTNIFQQLNYGLQGRSSQEEKIRGLARQLRWTPQDLRRLMELRAEAASRRSAIVPIKTLDQFLPRKNRNAGDPVDYIIDRTLLRPRDAIMFLNACARAGTGKEKMSWENIRQAEKEYSRDRLDALRDEWKDPYVNIEKVFLKFQRTPHRLSRDGFTKVLDEIAMLLADSNFLGTPWLTEYCEQIWAPDSSRKSWFDWYGRLVELLYLIAFIGVARTARGPAVYSYEQQKLIETEESLPETTFFEVHPAFRVALNISEQRDN